MTAEALEVQVDRNIEDYFTADTYTPYKLAQVVQGILVDAGVQKILPPQMFYQYTALKNGKQRIATVDGNAGKGRVVARDVAIEWTEKYLQKNA